MPAIQPGSGSKILVTGANGYIAAWVVRSLLENGYAVRGTVRSASKGAHLSKLFGEKYGDKFEIVIVEDITKEGAFDEAVKDVDGVEHTASPFHLNADDPQELIKPAVDGTIGILKSVLKNGTKVKRVVVTSSCASVFHVADKPVTFSESDWNNQSIEMIKELGNAAPPAAKYRASKTLAEKAAWNLYNANKNSISWDLTVLNPPFVFGPVIHDVSTPSSLNTSALDFYNITLTENSGGISADAIAENAACWIDVRDLGTAHVLALEKEAAGGERILVCAGPFCWQDWIDAVHAISPPPYKSGRALPKGVPGTGKTVPLVQFNTAKAEKILDLKYRTKEETAKDAVADFVARGW